MISLICGILNSDTNELIYKAQTDSQTQKTKTYGYQRGRGEEDKLEILGYLIQTTR